MRVKMYINCENYLGMECCLIGECYISLMPQETPQETIDEHIKNCVSKKAVNIIKKRFGKLEKKLNKNF